MTQFLLRPASAAAAASADDIEERDTTPPPAPQVPSAGSAGLSRKEFFAKNKVVKGKVSDAPSNLDEL